jgi:hypothetical protein
MDVDTAPPHVLVAPYQEEDEARCQRYATFLPTDELRAEVEHWERMVEYERWADGIGAQMRRVEKTLHTLRPKGKVRDKQRVIITHALKMFFGKPDRDATTNADFAEFMRSSARQEDDPIRMADLLKLYGSEKKLAKLIGEVRPWLDVAWAYLESAAVDEPDRAAELIASRIIQYIDSGAMARRRGRPPVGNRAALSPADRETFLTEIAAAVNSRKRASGD